jgi:hypothetical protein
LPHAPPTLTNILNCKNTGCIWQTVGDCWMYCIVLFQPLDAFGGPLVTVGCICQTVGDCWMCCVVLFQPSGCYLLSAVLINGCNSFTVARLYVVR